MTENQDRAAWAGKAIAAFMKEVGGDIEDALCDLLCDLMHWADQNGQDFDLQLARGNWHYDQEKLEELKDERDAKKQSNKLR